MHTFATPEPISVALDLEVGEVRVRAVDSAETTVEVRPANAARDADVRFAEEARVDFTGGQLTVRGPRSREMSPLGHWFGRGGAIDVVITVPAGSRVNARGLAEFHCEGRLGDCRITSGTGGVHVDRADGLRVRTDDGDVSVNAVAGPVEVFTAHGEIRVGSAGGPVSLKTDHGDIALGAVSGDARLVTAHGDITVDSADTDVTARTSSGRVRVASVASGTADLETGDGDIEVGVAKGTAAWLDVSSEYGHVRSDLDPAGTPDGDEAVVRVRARTQHGDAVIRHA
ncbi:DUF4097 family beta strand repeat-containing protein [Actinomadura kijaniata]|uniref:DUF4097 domain-containing protein n=1 Tax=Actinomadura namibiensis TaxID=182080 RepID=A0A7W3LV18_ACTNM|nr:DUF4097 family beta strand repeat-containing protein [Actinomadura namibiensis]MBA8954750.1 hypothetical protein [Actinomadura namibiensis]